MELQQRKQFRILLAVIFIGFLGLSMPYLIFPALFLNPDYVVFLANEDTSVRSIMLVLTLAVYPLGQFIGSPILGSLSDEYGRKKLISISLIFAAFSSLLSAWAIDGKYLWLLILSRFIAGLMEGNLAIARAMATDMKSISKHETFGKINAYASIAFILGPLLGGVLSEKSWFNHSISFPFYVICLLFAFLALITYVWLKPIPRKTAIIKRSIWERVNLPKKFSCLFVNKKARFLILVSTSLTLAIDIFYEFAPIYLTVSWLLSPAQLTLYNASLCIGLAIGDAFLPKFLSRFISHFWLISVSTIIFTLCLIGLPYTQSAFLMLTYFFLIGIFVGLAVTLITIDISEATTEEAQGEVFGVQLSLRVLGDAFICIFGGFLLLLSSSIVLLIASIISFLTACYYFKIFKTVSD